MLFNSLHQLKCQTFIIHFFFFFFKCLLPNMEVSKYICQIVVNVLVDSPGENV